MTEEKEFELGKSRLDPLWDLKINMKKKDLIDLIQCYYRTRDSDDFSILGRSDEIVDKIAKRYGYGK